METQEHATVVLSRDEVIRMEALKRAVEARDLAASVNEVLEYARQFYVFLKG